MGSGFGVLLESKARGLCPLDPHQGRALERKRFSGDQGWRAGVVIAGNGGGSGLGRRQR
jgi:hypothetical protein